MAVDKELIQGINLMYKGKEEGFNILYSTTYDYVYRRAKYIMQNEEDTLDLVQETYIQAYRGISTLSNANNIYAWLGAIVYNCGMKLFRKKKEILVDEDAETIFTDIVSEDLSAQPEESAETKATSKVVMDIIDELPELQRAAVLAFYYDNMKIDEIAKIFECSPNTIKSRLNYAKQFIKEKVQAHEKKYQYKLCSVTPVLLLYALKGMFAKEKYKALPKATQHTYQTILRNIGGETIKATASATAKTGMALGTKVGIGIATFATTVSVVAVTAMNLFKNNPQETITTQQESDDEANQDELVSDPDIEVPEGCFFKDGVLVVTPAFKMENYIHQSQAPWKGECRDATKLIVQEGVSEIGNYLFYQFSKLETVELPKGLKRIGSHAFYECKALKRLELQEGLETIETNSFRKCENLEELILPSTTKTIGEFAFKFSGLQNLELNDGLELIQYRAFKDCNKLTELRIPGSVYMESEAFNGCGAVETIIIEEGVTKLEFYTFANNISLTSIELPSSITEIDTYAFAACWNFTTIKGIPGSYAEQWTMERDIEFIASSTD